VKGMNSVFPFLHFTLRLPAFSSPFSLPLSLGFPYFIQTIILPTSSLLTASSSPPFLLSPCDLF